MTILKTPEEIEAIQPDQAILAYTDAAIAAMFPRVTDSDLYEFLRGILAHSDYSIHTALYNIEKIYRKLKDYGESLPANYEAIINNYKNSCQVFLPLIEGHDLVIAAESLLEVYSRTLAFIHSLNHHPEQITDNIIFDYMEAVFPLEEGIAESKMHPEGRVVH